jgi:amino acid transporter
MFDFGWSFWMVFNAVIVVLLAVIVLWKIRRERKSGYPRQDERTSKLSGKAALAAFWISYAYMLSLMLLNIFGTEFLGFPESDAGWYILSIMLVSSISFGLLRWYYSRKGDQ